MRAHNIIITALVLTTIIIIAAFVQAAPKTVYLSFEIKNIEDGSDPVHDATVQITRLDNPTESWTRTTGTDGITTEEVETILNEGSTYIFKVSITATGFQSKTVDLQKIFSSPEDPHYTFPTLTLTPVETTDPACNDDADNDGDGLCDFDGSPGTTGCSGDRDPGCENAEDTDEYNAPEAAGEGVLIDVKIISGANPACDEGYAEEGSWTPPTGGTYKLCAKYTPVFDFTGQDVIDMATIRPAAGDQYCEEGETQGQGFAGGTQSFVLCYSKTNIPDATALLTETYVNDVAISNSCPISVPSDPFKDSDSNTLYFCTGLQNYGGTQGECQLEEPKWVKDFGGTRGVDEIKTEDQPIVGWLSNQDDQVYQFGDPEVFLRVKAAGCLDKAVEIEVWEGDPTRSTEPFEEAEPGANFGANIIAAGEGRVGDYAALAWPTIGWYEKTTGFPGLDPQSNRKYYFKAKIPGTTIETPFSPLLLVRKPDEAQCIWNNDATDLNDPDCPDGQVCIEGNICQDFSCLGDPNICTDGLFCDEDESSDTVGQCIECYTTEDCTENTAAYSENAEYYFCQTTDPDATNYKMCDSDECLFHTLEFRNQRDNVIDEAIGWITNDPAGLRVDENNYQWGSKVKLHGAATGCEDVENIKFVIIEEDSLLGIETEEIVMSLDVERYLNSQYFIFQDWKPRWFVDSEHLFGLISGKEGFEYRFYAAEASDLETPLGGKSEVLTVEKPDEAECDPDYNPNDPDNDEDYDGPTICEAGKRCVEGNRCVTQCRNDAGCEDEKYCANSTRDIGGAIEGSCYECFEDPHCEDLEDTPRCQVNITKDSAFSCVQCMNNTDCPEVNGNPGICAEDNTCTTTCNPDNDNADCLSFRNSVDFSTISDRTERAEAKGKDVCHPEHGICVQCTSNFDPDNSENSCDPNEICCPEGTACLTEENRCVECLEDSICGPGGVCDTDNNVCISGGPTLGLLGEGVGGVVMGALGALVGFFIGGPMGAAIGGIAGLLLGGGLGGEGGGFLGGIGDLLGGFLTYLSTLM